MCPSQSLDATHPDTIPCLLGTLKTVNGGAPMDELLSAVLDVHGGLDNWQRVRTLRVGFSRSGPFWDARGWPDLLANGPATLNASTWSTPRPPPRTEPRYLTSIQNG